VQIGEPDPSTPQPIACAARAAAFISSTALAQRLRPAFHVGRGEGEQPIVVAVAHALAGQVRTERPAPQLVVIEKAALLPHIGGVRRGLADVHVVAPAGDLEAIVAPLRRLAADLFEREVRPLAGEDGDWAHVLALSFQLSAFSSQLSAFSFQLRVLCYQFRGLADS
jgi:hypothetical protein